MRRTSRGPIVSEDPRVAIVLETIDRIAASSCTVLVTGESGTGKELVVAALHDASPRKSAPLITINCGALPENLVEGELFGHVKGAYSGADETHAGLVAAAEGGTLFLDEIGEVSLAIQVKLLRLLQQREYTPLGANRPIKCDVRIVAATNKDLASEVKAGRFREDLFYRLNVIPLCLPPLRERAGDMRLLARHFFRVFAEARPDLRGLSEETIAAIQKNRWPGNVRELENAIERGVLLARGPFVEPGDLFGQPITVPRPPLFSVPPPTAAIPSKLPEAGVSLFATLEAYENSLVKQALRRTNGNRNKAAQLLGMNRTTLVEMIRRRGLS